MNGSLRNIVMFSICLLIIAIIIGYGIIFLGGIKTTALILFFTMAFFVIFNPRIGMYLLIISLPFTYNEVFQTYFSLSLGRYRIWFEDIIILLLVFAFCGRIVIKKFDYTTVLGQNIILWFVGIIFINIFLSIFTFPDSIANIISRFIYSFKTSVEYLLLYFIGFNLIKKHSHAKRIIYLSIFAFIITSGYALIAYLPTYKEAFYLLRLGGGIAYYSPNTFSICCLMILSLLIFQLFYIKRIALKLLIIILSMFLLFCVIRTASRIGFLSLGVLLLIVFFIHSNKKYVVAIIIISIFISNMFIEERIKTRLTQAINLTPQKHTQVLIKFLGRSFYVDGAIAYRYTSLISIPKIALLSIFTGQSYVFSEFCLPENNYLEILLKSGMIGLCLFLWFLILIFKKLILIKKEVKDPFTTSITSSGITIIIITSFASLTARIFFSPRVAILMWLLLGVILKIGMLETKEVK